MDADTTRAIDFAELADRLRPYLRSHCHRMLGPAGDVEDAVQETLIRAWRSRARFQARSSLRWWMRCIATNVCRDQIRRRARQRTDPRPFDDDDSSDLVRQHPSGQDPEEVSVADDAVTRAYLVALRRLPRRQLAALVLCDHHHMSAIEAAAALGCTTAAVNSALQRARRNRASLRDQDDAMPATSAERAVLRRVLAAHHLASPIATLAALDAA